MTWKYRLPLIALSIGFIGALHHIGNKYLKGFQVEYGHDLNIFGMREGAFYFLYCFLGIFAIVFLLLATYDYFEKLLKKIKLPDVKTRNYVILLCLLAFALTACLRFFVLIEAPMTDDENAYKFGASIFATGKLFLRGYIEELRPFLRNQFIVIGERSFTQYFPGFMLLLSLFQKINLEWALNSLSAAALVYATYLLGRDMFCSKWIGFTAALLLLTSTCFLYTSATLFSHPVAAVFGAFGLYFCWHAREKRSLLFSIASGAFLGFMLLVRPLSAAIFGVAAACIIALGLKARQFRYLQVVLWLLAGASMAAFLLYYNYLVSGDLLKTPYAAYREYAIKVWGVDKDYLVYFSSTLFAKGKFLELLALPFLRFNFWLFGWPCSFFLLFFIKRSYATTLLMSIVIGVWLIHLSWPSVGVNLTGAVHYYEVLPLLAVLSASGFSNIINASNSRIKSIGFGAVVFSIALSFAVFFPWATNNLGRVAAVNQMPYDMAKENAKLPAIILVPNAQIVINTPATKQKPFNTWTFFRKNNRPDLTDKILWMNDLGPKNSLLLRLFPNRHYYRMVPIHFQNGNSTWTLIESDLRPNSSKIENNSRAVN